MNEFKSWCRIICIVTIVSGTLVTLLPKSKLEPAFKALVALILINAIMMPFSDKDKIEDSIGTKNTSAVFDQQTLYGYNKNMVYECAQDLMENQIEEYIFQNNFNGECEVYIGDADGEPIVEKISIIGSFESEEAEKIEAYIKSIGGDVPIEFIEN